ncbi:MAG: FecR domain-containing protein [Bacteroidales bacterium]|nr:FecR domain-containing protein [Bacteroidales bacterium]
MRNKEELRRLLLDNSDEAQMDIVLRQLYNNADATDERLADKGFEAFSRRTGIERHRKIKTVSRWTVRVAAALALPLVLLSVWAVRKAADADVQWLQVSTTYAQTRTVILSDGTSVTLQPCSQLYYPDHFWGKQRKVMLSGEAFLDVAKDVRRQFVVGAGNMDLVVHGTRFNVSSFPGNEEDEVALLDGSVEIRIRDKEGSVFLAPGEMVKYDKTEGSIVHRNFAVNYYEEVLNAGGLQFNNERLADIAAELNRHFNASIVVEDSSVASVRYLASFINGESLDEILAALNTGGQFRIVKKDKFIYITK